MLARALTFALLVCLLPATSRAQTRVLFIGNSYTYTNDLPGMFDALATSLGEDVETAMSAPGGYTFNLHTQNTTTLNYLAQGDWDYVVLQEQSQLPSFPLAQVESECFPYAAQLVDLARQANPCVEPVFLMTWGRELGDDQNCASWPPVCTYEGMQALLRERYVRMANDNSASCAPAGAVWREQRAQFPAIGLYTDGSHPNALGSYIAASSLYSTIFKRSCETASYAPAGVTPAQGAIVRALASAIVLDSASIWNIGANEPVADADWTLLGGTSIQFSDNSVGAGSWAWDFGDGSFSIDPDPLHTFADADSYNVTLVITDVCGRTDTATLVVNLTTSVSESGRLIPWVRYSSIEGCLVNGSGESLLIELNDGTGRLIAHERVARNATIPLSLAPGCVFWRAIRTDGSIVSGRFIVAR